MGGPGGPRRRAAIRRQRHLMRYIRRGAGGWLRSGRMIDDPAVPRAAMVSIATVLGNRAGVSYRCAMAIRFTAVPFFVYPVSDMTRARAFYEGVLGLRRGANWEDAWQEYEVGETGGVIALSTMMEGCTPGARGGAAALETTDFDAAVEELRSRGVSFVLDPVDTGVCHFARFLDPDGNHLVLHRAHSAESRG